MADKDSIRLPSTQVKLQLTTRHSEISLPENTGPILVNTSKCQPFFSLLELTDQALRFTAVCPVHSRERSVGNREANTI